MSSLIKGLLAHQLEQSFLQTPLLRGNLLDEVIPDDTEEIDLHILYQALTGLHQLSVHLYTFKQIGHLACKQGKR